MADRRDPIVRREISRTMHLSRKYFDVRVAVEPGRKKDIQWNEIMAQDIMVSRLFQDDEISGIGIFFDMKHSSIFSITTGVCIRSIIRRVIREEEIFFSHRNKKFKLKIPRNFSSNIIFIVLSYARILIYTYKRWFSGSTKFSKSLQDSSSNNNHSYSLIFFYST